MNQLFNFFLRHFAPPDAELLLDNMVGVMAQACGARQQGRDFAILLVCSDLPGNFPNARRVYEIVMSHKANFLMALADSGEQVG